MNDGSNGARRIVHVASGDLWAGAEAQILALASAQREHLGHDVHAILLNDGTLAERLRDAGIFVTVLPETRLSFPALLNRTRKHLRRLAPDVVHTHRQKENLLGALANRLATGAVCVRTVHGASEHRGVRQRLQRRLDILIGRFLQQAVVAVSETLATQLIPSFGAGRVHVVRNGLHLRPYAGARIRQDRSGPFRIGFFGRLVPVKRVDLLLDAFERLVVEGGVTAELHIVGDGPLRPELEARRDRSRAAAWMRFHGHLDDPRAAMETMDCVVLCSDHEGTPMTMLEAMALGVPLVVHAVGGMHETLAPANAAELVDRHDAIGYADAFRRLAGSPERRAQLSDRAWQQLLQEHELQQCAERYDRVYTAGSAGRRLPQC